MASSSITNFSKAFNEGDDLDTVVNRALYYEPVSHAFRKYSSFSLTEEDIARTVEKASGDGEYLANLLMEHHEALSTFEDQPMDIEILEALKTPKHQSKVAAQQEEPITHLSASTTPFTPKGKQKRVSYADMVKQDPKDDVSRPSSPTPSGGKKRKTAPVLKANASQSPSKTTKKQPAATSPKTISTVMTGYVIANKDFTRKITVYDILSTWSQLDTLNHLKAWGQVVAIKFKSQQKYVTVTVSIELNQEATKLWNDGAWTAPLGGLPIRWFPANWDLKQRKEREQFQAVIKGVPASVNTATLYPENHAHSILAPIGCKAFKLIQDWDTRKLITYYESWADLNKVIGKPFSLDEFTGDWMMYFTPNLKQRRRNLQKVN
ncbi:hypothetical protein GLOIN_2v1473242 [Rhizophagus irregularis DAOM 181602=DAOM 197198]|nr:hypothetical protein GLOIN_2v1473242 [Rhizophagus irregularis DAOM 181602=DAOM 197198]